MFETAKAHDWEALGALASPNFASDDRRRRYGAFTLASVAAMPLRRLRALIARPQGHPAWSTSLQPFGVLIQVAEFWYVSSPKRISIVMSASVAAERSP